LDIDERTGEFCRVVADLDVGIEFGDRGRPVEFD